MANKKTKNPSLKEVRAQQVENGVKLGREFFYNLVYSNTEEKEEQLGEIKKENPILYGILVQALDQLEAREEYSEYLLK